MGDRIWTCDTCGKRGTWDRKRWCHVFIGGPCAVFCSDDCCNRWHDKVPLHSGSHPPLANYTRDGALLPKEKP